MIVTLFAVVTANDPTELMESLGDNTVEASTLGIANLKRVMGYLIPATTKFGEDYSELGNMYGAVRGQVQCTSSCCSGDWRHD